MKTIVLYYSLGGSTKLEAEKIAEKENAVICRVEEVKKRSLFAAVIPGAPYAMKRKAVSIKSLNYDLTEFDKIIIGSPVWGGFPAPAFNAIVQKIPSEKDVELFFCSGGGATPKSKQGTMDMIAAKGCNLLSYKDIGTARKK